MSGRALDKNRVISVGWMLLSALLFAAMQLAATITGPDIPVMEQLLFRNVFSLVFLALFHKKGNTWLGTRAQQPLLWAWSLTAGLSVVCLFLSVREGDQGSVAVICRTSGFWVTLLAWLFLKEKISRLQLLAVFLAFAGAALTAGPVSAGGMSAFSAGMALAEAILASLSTLFLGMLKNKADPLAVAIHFSVVCILLSLPFTLANFVRPSGGQLLCMLFVGLFGAAGQLAQIWSFARAPVAEVNIYGYSGILFSMLLGRLFLGEVVGMRALAGAAIIIGAALLTYRGAHREPEPIPAKPSGKDETDGTTEGTGLHRQSP